MSFKMWSRLGLAGSLVVLGCGLNTGEKPPDTIPPSFQGREYTCVGEIPQHLQKYIDDELSEAQITSFVQCLQRAFTSFLELTRGRDSQVYEPNEIRRFLQSTFFKSRVITDGFTSEIVTLKRLLFGGTQDTVTRKELQEAIAFLDEVRQEAIRMKPYLRYLNPKLVDRQDPDEVGRQLKVANAELNAVIDRVSQRLNKTQLEYRFSNVHNLMAEFRQFVRWEEAFEKDQVAPVEAWVKFFREFKSATVSPKVPESVQRDEWAPFLKNLSRWYFAYIQYRVGVKDRPIIQGAGLRNSMYVAQQIFDLVEEAIKNQPGEPAEKSLSLVQIHNIINAAQGLNWLNPKIRSESLDRALSALFDRVFSPDKSVARRRLDLETLKQIKYEFYRWAYIQMRLETQFKRKNSKIETRVPSLLTRFVIPKDVSAILKNMHEPDWNHFLQIKDLTRPLFNDNLERVTLVGESELDRFHLAHEFHNLSMMNLFRSAVGMLFRGYAGEINGRVDWKSGLKSEELQRFYEDIRDLAVDLQLADGRIHNTGTRAFTEGKLFTYSAEGIAFDLTKSRLSYVEAMELLAFLYSGGQMSADLYDYFYNQSSCAKGDPDQYGLPTIDRACVERALPDLIQEFGVNLPGMTAYLASAPEGKRVEIIRNLILSAYSPKHSHPQWMEKNELGIVSVILHYMEAVLTRFDTNQDGVLTNDEVRAAVPVFRGFVQKFAKDHVKTTLSDRQAEGVFLYLLHYKELPTWWNMVHVYYLSYDFSWTIDLGWGLGSIELNFNTPLELDRAELSKVFRAIVAKIFQTAAPAPSH